MQKVFDSSKNKTTPFVLSDSNGNFKVRSQFIGMVRPPKYRIRFSKPGYETIELKFNGNNDRTHLSNDSLLIQLKENGMR